MQGHLHGKQMTRRKVNGAVGVEVKVRCELLVARLRTESCRGQWQDARASNVADQDGTDNKLNNTDELPAQRPSIHAGK